jgi:glycosyltransferase involved in cell wall biosynthesis
MNILYLAAEIDISYPHGGTTHISEVVKSLANLGHKIFIIVKKGEFKYKNVKFYRIPVIKNGVLRYIFSYFIFVLLKSLSIIRKEKIDLIYERCHLFLNPGVLAAKMNKIPSIYEMNEPIIDNQLHNKNLSRFNPYFLALKWAFQINASLATFVTVTNKNMINYFNPSKAYLMYYGTSLNKYKSKEYLKIIKKYDLYRGKTFVYIGSFPKWHNVNLIIKDATEAIKKDNSIKVILIGNGETWNDCNKLIRKLSIEKNIIMTGQVPHEKIADYINAADAGLAIFDKEYPSFKKMNYYFSPIKIYEYMSYAKPVIATDIGNLKEIIINKQGGFLTNNNDLSQKILEITKNPKNSIKMGKFNKI